MGVEGSGAVSGSEEKVKIVKKESIDVFRCVSELLCSSFFDWGLLDGMSFDSLSFIRFMVGLQHKDFRETKKKNNNRGVTEPHCN
jgi:hypothetical protein